MPVVGGVLPSAAERARWLLAGARVLASSGLARPVPPAALIRAAAAAARDGLSPATAYAYGAARYPREAAVIDQRGACTFAEMATAVTAAAALRGAGVGSGSRVGVLCGNHRDFCVATAASSALGATTVFLDPSSPAPALADVLAGQRVGTVVHDEELAPVPVPAHPRVRWLAVAGNGAADGAAPPTRLADLPPGPGHRLRHAPLSGGRYVLLTSGTTSGRAGSTARAVPLSPDPVVALLSRLPLRVRDVTLVASPLFHAWGFGQLGMALLLSSTVVLRPRFDPEATLAAVAQHRVRVLVAVPAMLHALVELPPAVRRRYDTGCLQVVASSGSALPGDLAVRFMDAFGDVLYNVYGSTEAAWATIATPGELRLAPGTAGRAPVGTDVRVVDQAGRPAAPGVTGRILVRNSLGVPPEDAEADLAPGFVATGDLGHLDGHGLLHVDGRQDDMIVTGGENVRPREVEDVLLSHPGVLEAAVVGVPDPRYGQRVRAVVVARPGANPTEADLKAHARARLARAKVPRDVRFVDRLPRTATGKPLARELRRRL